MTSFSRFSSSALIVLAAACGPHHAAAQGSSPAPAADPGLPPAGFGSLRQDDIGVQLQLTDLRVRIIPLDERVIRLLSPDAYRSLRDMRESRAQEIRAAARFPGDSTTVFMVTYFGMQPQTRFSPDQLLISSQNATYRPLGIVPITPRFNENQLDAREQAAAVYVFEPGIAILRPFTVLYGSAQSDAWSQALNRINTERSRVLGRASQAESRP